MVHLRQQAGIAEPAHLLAPALLYPIGFVALSVGINIEAEEALEGFSPHEASAARAHAFKAATINPIPKRTHGHASDGRAFLDTNELRRGHQRP